MLDKYVEERFERFFVFGSTPDGRVGVQNASCSVEVTVTPEEAARLMVDRNAVVDFICKIAEAFDRASPDAFKKFWYEDTRK